MTEKLAFSVALYSGSESEINTSLTVRLRQIAPKQKGLIAAMLMNEEKQAEIFGVVIYRASNVLLIDYK